VPPPRRRRTPPDPPATHRIAPTLSREARVWGRAHTGDAAVRRHRSATGRGLTTTKGADDNAQQRHRGWWRRGGDARRSRPLPHTATAARRRRKIRAAPTALAGALPRRHAALPTFAAAAAAAVSSRLIAAMRHCQRSPPPPPLRSPPGSSQPQGGGASSFASGVTASVAAATDTALRRRQRRKRHTTLIGRRWGPPWGGCGRRRLRRPTNQWSVCRGRSAPQRLRQRRRHPSAPTPSPASGQPPRSTVMAATSTCGRAAVAFPQHPPLSPERVQRHRFQKAHGRHAASLPQSLLFVPPPRAADSPLVSNAANGAHLSWTGRRGRLPPAPLSPPLQEKSPGISRVLGPRNPGLMEEKPPLRRPSSALNIPALPGYTWMQGSPQASRGAIATRDP